MDRRAFMAMVAASGGLLAGAGSVLGAGADIPLGTPSPFSEDVVVALAAARASQPYAAPATVPQAWTDLTYDQYRRIRFRPEAALLGGTSSPFEVQLFAPGFYFRSGVSISLVADGQARPVRFEREAFAFGDGQPDLPDGDTLNYSGFRLHAVLNRADYRDEFAVFQGASYLRAVARGQNYGLSARGLAIDTAEAEGEEFPIFDAFWIETPATGAEQMRVHALLDSPSVAGAYRFDITPGDITSMAVKAVLFPRRELAHVGIAPLTSMFLFDETNRSRFDDFRRAVHDSDGLMVVNGAGEALWRPLANPGTLQISQFLDRDPRAFGLVQRRRELADFADLEAHYQSRPSAWVTPKGSWGPGAVVLVEIPTDLEIHDNIVAYWRPVAPLAAGTRFELAYRLDWGAAPTLQPGLAIVANTAMGARPEGGRRIAIDFVGDLPEPDAVLAEIVARPGAVAPPVVETNPATGGLRVVFGLDPQGADAVELRAQLRDAARRPLSEVWLYRWTA